MSKCTPIAALRPDAGSEQQQGPSMPAGLQQQQEAPDEEINELYSIGQQQQGGELPHPAQQWQPMPPPQQQQQQGHYEHFQAAAAGGGLVDEAKKVAVLAVLIFVLSLVPVATMLAKYIPAIQGFTHADAAIKALLAAVAIVVGCRWWQQR